MTRRRWLALALLVPACGTTALEEDVHPLLHQDGGAIVPVVDASTDAKPAADGSPTVDAAMAPDATTDAGSDADANADADADADAEPDADADADADAGADADADAGPDAPLDAAPPECTSDADCADAFACTHDACSPDGVCVHAADDKLCDDALFCTGIESCDPSLGCVTAPVICDDGVACTQDACSEASQSCVAKPDDALCPISHKCDAQSGCYALAYAHDQSTLYEVRLPSGTVKPIGPLGAASITDIALHPDGTLYAVSFSALYTVDPGTGKATPKMSASAPNVNALDAAPDGTLYAGGGSTLFQVDTMTGLFQAIAAYPNGTSSSGDIAFVGGRLLASAQTSGGDVLVEIHPDTGETSVLGAIGFSCVWGLAAFGPTLYGLTCNGEVVSIDPDSGQGTLLSQSPVQFWGASAR